MLHDVHVHKLRLGKHLKKEKLIKLAALNTDNNFCAKFGAMKSSLQIM